MGRALAQRLAEILGPLSGAQVVVLALASGLAEEAFFRGALQPRVGLVIASLLFGLAHLVPRRELAPWAGFAALAGVLLGALFDYTGNLLAPAIAHVLVNGVNLRWLSEPPHDRSERRRDRPSVSVDASISIWTPSRRHRWCCAPASDP